MISHFKKRITDRDDRGRVVEIVEVNIPDLDEIELFKRNESNGVIFDGIAKYSHVRRVAGVSTVYWGDDD